jgi:hypothetical protein
MRLWKSRDVLSNKPSNAGHLAFRSHQELTI